jgi:hypothetical protein
MSSSSDEQPQPPRPGVRVPHHGTPYGEMVCAAFFALSQRPPLPSSPSLSSASSASSQPTVSRDAIAQFVTSRYWNADAASGLIEKTLDDMVGMGWLVETGQQGSRAYRAGPALPAATPTFRQYADASSRWKMAQIEAEEAAKAAVASGPPPRGASGGGSGGGLWSLRDQDDDEDEDDEEEDDKEEGYAERPLPPPPNIPTGPPYTVMVLTAMCRLQTVLPPEIVAYLRKNYGNTKGSPNVGRFVDETLVELLAEGKIIKNDQGAYRPAPGGPRPWPRSTRSGASTSSARRRPRRLQRRRRAGTPAAVPLGSILAWASARSEEEEEGKTAKRGRGRVVDGVLVSRRGAQHFFFSRGERVSERQRAPIKRATTARTHTTTTVALFFNDRSVMQLSGSGCGLSGVFVSVGWGRRTSPPPRRDAAADAPSSQRSAPLSLSVRHHTAFLLTCHLITH